MRIIDWSSDLCSSDLATPVRLSAIRSQARRLSGSGEFLPQHAPVIVQERIDPLHPRHDGHPHHLTLPKTLHQEIKRRLRIHTPDRQEKVIAHRSETAPELTAIGHRPYWRKRKSVG